MKYNKLVRDRIPEIIEDIIQAGRHQFCKLVLGEALRPKRDVPISARAPRSPTSRASCFDAIFIVSMAKLERGAHIYNSSLGGKYGKVEGKAAGGSGGIYEK